MNTLEERAEAAKKLLFKSPFVRLMGVELTLMEEGHVIGRAPLKEELLNPYGTMHGGCLYALADTVAGTVANLCGQVVMTVNGAMNFLVAAGNSEYIYCDATLVRCGKTLVTVRAELKNDEGKLLDDATFTFYRTGVDVVTAQ